MGTITINKRTPKDPITFIGEMAGTCYGSDISDPIKNYKRGIQCLKDGHGRTFEFPDIVATIEGYSARVIREWYTHIGGAPTRLQASTRYIKYGGFGYITPPSIKNNEKANALYIDLIDNIYSCYGALESEGIPKEDIANILPLGMETTIVDKRNLRNVMDMAPNRLCTRAYWEFRLGLMKDYLQALSDYSEEWKYLVDNYMKPKCEICGYCTEKFSCGRKPKKEDK